jgi:hypothetical protein
MIVLPTLNGYEIPMTSGIGLGKSRGRRGGVDGVDARSKAFSAETILR